MRAIALLPALAALLASGPPARAQGAPAFVETFDFGLPSDWSVRGARPLRWYVTEDGECGAVSRALAYGVGEPACGYSALGLATGGAVRTPPIPWWALRGRIEFTYELEIDVPGDHVSLWLLAVDEPGLEPLQVAGTADFWNDGWPYPAWFDLELDVAWYGVDVAFEFRFRADGVGDGGLGWRIDDVAVFEYSLSHPYCFSWTGVYDCPCGNDGTYGAGCGNGSFADGCELRSLGLPSVGADSLALTVARSVPGQPGMFFQGDNELSGWPFGDGLRCAGGNVRVLEVLPADTTGAAATTLPLARMGGISPGDTRRYQWWYRDPVASPCGGLFNLSNGLEVVWSP